MGGPKEPTLSRTEERRKTQGKKEAEPERPSQTRREKSYAGVASPPTDAVAAFVKSQSYVTPYVLGERFGLKLGVAKRLLRQMERDDIITLVAGDNRVGIYAPSASPNQSQGDDEEKPPKARTKARKG